VLGRGREGGLLVVSVERQRAFATFYAIAAWRMHCHPAHSSACIGSARAAAHPFEKFPRAGHFHATPPPTALACTLAVNASVVADSTCCHRAENPLMLDDCQALDAIIAVAERLTNDGRFSAADVRCIVRDYERERSWRFRSVRRAMGIWIRVHTASVAADYAFAAFRERTHQLSDAVDSQRVQLDVLRQELNDAREAARLACVQASGAIERADERVHESQRAVMYDWQTLQVEMRCQLGDALEEQRLDLLAAKEVELEEAKREWYMDANEYDRSRDVSAHAMQLRLCAAQTHACQLLVDKEQLKDDLTQQRLASPTRALHSLLARGRAQQVESSRARGRHSPKTHTHANTPNPKTPTPTSASNRSPSISLGIGDARLSSPHPRCTRAIL